MFRKPYHPLDRRHPNNSATPPDLSTSALPIASRIAPSDPVHLSAHEVFARKGKRQKMPSRATVPLGPQGPKIKSFVAAINTAYSMDKWVRLGALAFFMAVLLSNPDMRHAFFEVSRAAVTELVTGEPTHMTVLSR